MAALLFGIAARPKLQDLAVSGATQIWAAVAWPVVPAR
jgi:hypothetical protein